MTFKKNLLLKLYKEVELFISESKILFCRIFFTENTMSVHDKKNQHPSVNKKDLIKNV